MYKHGFAAFLVGTVVFIMRNNACCCCLRRSSWSSARWVFFSLSHSLSTVLVDRTSRDRGLWPFRTPRVRGTINIPTRVHAVDLFPPFRRDDRRRPSVRPQQYVRSIQLPDDVCDTIGTHRREHKQILIIIRYDVTLLCNFQVQYF